LGQLYLFMKNKFTYRTLCGILILSIAFLFSACKKDSATSISKPQKPELAVQDARSWLESSDPKIMLGERWNSVIFMKDANGDDIIKVKVNESLKNNIWTLRDILIQRDDTGNIEAIGYEVQVDNSYFTTKKGAELPGANKREFIDNADFTGKIILYTLKNKAIKGTTLLDGKIVSELVTRVRRTDLTTLGQQGLDQELDCVGSFDSAGQVCTSSGTNELTEVNINKYVPLPNYNWIFGGANPANTPAPVSAGGPDIPIGNPGGYSGGGNGDSSTNKEIIDSLKGYPCAQALVAKLPSLKTDIANLIKNTFSVSDYVNVTFEPDKRLIGSTTDGRFNQVSGSSYIIGLNPDVLKNASKEYILVTLYHEALHAYFAEKREIGRSGV